MGKVTLEDISRALDVSANTASKALRGAPGVSDELRNKIIQLASEMGYKRAGQLSNNSLKNITMIGRKIFLSDVTFWSHILQGITQYADDKNIKISIANIDEIKEDKADTFSSIISHSSDGYIILGTIGNYLLKKIIATNIPTIVVDHFSQSVDCDYINSSNKSGIYKAVEYLYENNHKNIGFIGNSITAVSLEERYEAYLKYMKELSLPVQSEFVWLDAPYIITEYYKSKINLHGKSKNFPTAWICVNDNTALTFMNALMELGIKVPEDISIIGFDNINNLSYPGLTTVDVPKQSIGEKAVEQLLFRAENPNAPYVNIVFNTKLVKRSSVKKLNGENSK